MTAYIVTFLVTMFFSYIDERNLLKEKPNRLKHIIMAAFIIVLPAVLAGLRDYSIGTDVQIYAKSVFECAVRSSSVNSVLERYSELEHGFLMLAFIVSRITSSVHFFLFSIAFIIQLFVYLALYRTRKYCSIFMGESVYLFLIYNASLNMMRQTIAMAILLFALTYLFEKKYLISLVWIFIGSFFHNSIIIGLLYFPVFIFFNGRKYVNDNVSDRKARVWFGFKTLLVIMAVTVVTASFQPLMLLLGKFGIISDRYSIYLGTENLSIKWVFFFSYIVCYLIVCLRRNKNKQGYFFLTIGLIDIVIYRLKYIMYYLYRISTYYMICRIFSLTQARIDFGKILGAGKISKDELVAIVTWLVCFMQWFMFIAINNDHATMPYKFFF